MGMFLAGAAVFLVGAIFGAAIHGAGAINNSRNEARKAAEVKHE